MPDALGFALNQILAPRRRLDGFAALARGLGVDAVDGDRAFAVLHDTFHHHLAGEAEVFPERTGLVHISGVEEPGLDRAAMRDGHRVLVGGGDRLGNLEQIRALRRGGYAGPLSFEPFARSVQDMDDVASALRDSMAFIHAGLSEQARAPVA